LNVYYTYIILKFNCTAYDCIARYGGVIFTRIKNLGTSSRKVLDDIECNREKILAAMYSDR